MKMGKKKISWKNKEKIKVELEFSQKKKKKCVVTHRRDFQTKKKGKREETISLTWSSSLFFF